jgi:hypothetical protein
VRIQITLEVEHLGSPTLRMRIANIYVYIAYIPTLYCYSIIRYGVASFYI